MSAVYLVVGVLAGGLVTYLVARNIPNRPRLVISLTQEVSFSLADLGIQNVTLQHGVVPLPNLCVLELMISNRGSRLFPRRGGDIRTDWNDPKPRIDFVDFEIIGKPIFLNSNPGFYVPIAKSGGDKRIYVNVQRIAAGVTARIRLVGVRDDHAKPFTAEEVHFFPGALHNVDVIGEGLLRPPYLPG